MGERISLLKLVQLCSQVVLVLLLAGGAFGQQYPSDLVRRVDDAENQREMNLHGYTVTEDYKVFRRDGRDPAAEIVVHTTYKKGEGKSYADEVATGSTTLQKHVLERIMAEQKELSAGDARRAVLITSANYDMTPEREEEVLGRKCIVLKLHPKRKSEYLLEGEAWVDATNYHLVRVKGQVSAMPNLFVGHASVQRDYMEFQTFAVATQVTSESSEPVIGKTVVTVDYKDYHIIP